MKIYRVVPDSFVTGRKIYQQSLTGVEDIYYMAGYTSFLGKRGYHEYNNLGDCKDKDGKYFYLFAEDAVQEASKLIGGYHRLQMNTCSILEYDVPEDIILKNIGYGDYTEDIFPLHLLETYLEKSDLGQEIIATEELSEEAKTAYLVDTLSESLERIQKLDFSAYDDKRFYKEYFNVDNLDSIMADKEKLREAILRSNFYHAFQKENGELIKSPYITKRIVPVNTDYLYHELRTFGKIGEYYQEYNLNCDFSEEQSKFKDELLNIVKRKEQDKEKIKSLLKDGKYI